MSDDSCKKLFLASSGIGGRDEYCTARWRNCTPPRTGSMKNKEVRFRTASLKLGSSFSESMTSMTSWCLLFICRWQRRLPFLLWEWRVWCYMWARGGNCYDSSSIWPDASIPLCHPRLWSHWMRCKCSGALWYEMLRKTALPDPNPRCTFCQDKTLPTWS